MGSPEAQQNINHEQPGTSGQANIQSFSKAKHLIFLSHSGFDKPFVTKLYDALRRAGHDPFFDTHSLPPGEPFPVHIFQNASGCRLGVVVLSPDFLTSLWPMSELHSMHTSPSRPTILPLFFKVTPRDVKLSSPRFDEWRSAWRNHAMQSPSVVNLSEWEDATKNLAILSGVIYEPDKGEEVFIKKVLHHICRVVRPLLRYDVSHLTGCERLTQEVATLFEEIPSSSHFEARTIGLHGIGGQGKTTICKLMVNHYAGVYAGRCTLIEFPSVIGECQEANVLKQCKNALRQLTNISKRHISRVDDLDQCLQLLKDRVADLSVFIAIDNIWHNHLDWAQRIVDVGFNRESKLLVTSRSAQVLTSLLKDSKNVRALPSLNTEEAREIFLNSFHRNQQGTGVHLEESNLDEMTRCFELRHQNHPLTISALGKLLGRTDKRGWPTRWNEVHNLLQSDDNVVTTAIRINYDSIPEIRKNLFLDVALMIHILGTQGHPLTRTTSAIWAEEDGCSTNVDDNFDHLHTWLSALYKGRMDELKIIRTLKQLAFDGLLEFEDCFGLGHEEVSVHDLYIELAIQEGAANGKFLEGQENLRDTTIMYAEVERIVVQGNDLLRAEPLPKLGLLAARNWDHREWKLELMPMLRILKVWKKDRIDNESVSGWRNTPHLKWLELKAVTCEDISELCDLLVLKLQSCKLIMSGGRLSLNRLVNLQFLKLWRVKNLEEIIGLGSLINLKSMTLMELPHLRKVGTFSGRLKQLQVLEIEDCYELEDVQGLGLLPNLKALSCSQDLLCEEPRMFSESLVTLSLTNVKKAQPNLRDMSVLEALYLDYEGDRSVMGIGDGLAGRVKVMSLTGEVKKIGDIGQLPYLEKIVIYCCDGLKEIEWSSFHGLINLKEIEIYNCRDLKYVKGDSSSIAPTLQRVVIDNCRNLKRWW